MLGAHNQNVSAREKLVEGQLSHVFFAAEPAACNAGCAHIVMFKVLHAAQSACSSCMCHPLTIQAKTYCQGSAQTPSRTGHATADVASAACTHIDHSPDELLAIQVCIHIGRQQLSQQVALAAGPYLSCVCNRHQLAGG